MPALKALATALAATLALATAALGHGQNIGACVPAQAILGGNGGSQFVGVAPRTVRLRTGAYVDRITLNGSVHGGGGGQPAGALQLRPEEYINRVVVRHGSYVDRLELYTNFGRSIVGGGAGGNPTVLNNIRVLTIGGRAGSYLDQIQITYCRDYR